MLPSEEKGRPEKNRPVLPQRLPRAKDSLASHAVKLRPHKLPEIFVLLLSDFGF